MTADPTDDARGVPRAPRAAVYARLSRVKDDDRSIENQITDAVDLAERNGFQVIDTFVDAGRSAYTDVEREEFDRLLKAVNAGMVDVVVAWRFDRLTRSLESYNQLRKAVRKAGADIVTAQGDVDTRGNRSNVVMTIMNALAEEASANTSERVVRMRQRIESEGRYAGGSRAYGYTRNGLERVEDEARIVAEIFDRAAGGEGLFSICRDLNKGNDDRGPVPNATGGVWKVPQLRHLLRNRRYLGKVHNRVQGTEYDGQHPPLVDAELFDRVQAILDDPDRRQRRSVRKHFLTGVLTCEHCGHTFGYRWSHGQPAYGCGKQANDAAPGVHTACRGPVIRAEHIEPAVEAAVLRALARRSTRELIEARLGSGDSVRAQAMADIADANAVLEELDTQRWHDDPKQRMDPERYAAQVIRQRERIARAEAKLAAHQDAAVVAGLPKDADALGKHWQRHRDNPEYLRRLTQVVFAEIRVSRATPGVTPRDIGAYLRSRVTFVPHR